MANLTQKEKMSLIAMGVAIVLLAGILLAALGNRPTPGKVTYGEPSADAVTCTGTADDFEGPVTVEVVADAGTIYSLALLDYTETDGIGPEAFDQIPTAIVEQQSVAVDGIAGCTLSSDAIKQAVCNALENGGLDPTVFGMVAKTPAGPATFGEVSADAVTCTGSANGMDGPVTVEVVADAATLFSVAVTDHNETPGIGTVAAEQMPGKIVESQSVMVDSIAGCTVTSDAIKNAVVDALKNGGIDPTPFQKAVAAAAAVDRTPATLDCDVVVVGAGGAGLTAATTIAQAGKTVIVVEQMPIVGGNSLKATGGMNAAGTPEQQALGITDSGVQEFIDDTMNGGHQLNDLALVTVMAENSADAIAWLKGIGAPLPEVMATGGTTHKYLHEPEDGSAVGPFLVEKIGAAAEAEGVTIMLNTRAIDIIMKDGRAVGIHAEDAQHEYTINANAVVLATGGFGANFEMMAGYNPALANAVTTNHAGADGSGILMAEEVGAATVDMEQIQLHPTVYQENGMLISERLRSLGAVLVNSSGNRFTNDLSTRDAVSAAELEQEGAYAYIIFDQRIADEKAVQKYIASGLTVQGDTYEDLAKAIGFTGDAAANFVNTMNTWNETVNSHGTDEFGRNNGMDDDLSKAPFYAIKIAPGIHHTMGGVKINTDAQVIGTDGQPIPGLYAAGEVTGGVHGGNRIGGNAVCDFVVFGRIAGANAAAFAG